MPASPSAAATLEDQVTQAFAPDGVLAERIEHFQPRDGQTRMAQAVARTISQGGALVVEASTGVGKTFSYLVPALLSGERVLLSTATKTLQDQLFDRDLPRLAEVLGVPIRAALLKGRGSYLCLHRMEAARQGGALGDRASVQALARIEQWSVRTRTGDLAELIGLDERSALVPLVTSTRDNCLGSQCPRFKACHVNLARREAMAADLVVINHHLFFADQAVRESGVAELLPTAKIVVFDEAHQLNETGIQFLGTVLASTVLIDFARDTLGAGLQLARGLVDWQALVGEVERCTRELRLAAGRWQGNARLRWVDRAPEGVEAEPWIAALAALSSALEQASAGLEQVVDMGPDLARLAERCDALLARVSRFLGPIAPDAVRWVDVNQQLRMVESPLDIAQSIRAQVFGEGQGEGQGDVASGGAAAHDADDGWGEADINPPPWDDGDAPLGDEVAEAPEPGSRSWIFTSATLGTDERLSWFVEPCGLQDAQVLRVGSPFDYARQAALYVPRALPRPNAPQHSEAVADLVAKAAKRLGGRTLVLTTSLRALRTIGDRLTQTLADSALSVLVQGQGPKRRLIEQFRDAVAPGQAGAVLVGSASFWEGVDIPGHALQLVVIDKLPFPPPNDPLVEARSKRLEATGRSAFSDLSMPEAAVALKQGAGRLIRRETDHGALVVCDTRLVDMGYGRKLVAALPPMRTLTDPAAFDALLDELAAFQGEPSA